MQRLDRQQRQEREPQAHLNRAYHAVHRDAAHARPPEKFPVGRRLRLVPAFGAPLVQEEQDDREGRAVQRAHQIEAGRHAVRIAQPAAEQRADPDAAGQEQAEDAHQFPPLVRRREVAHQGRRDRQNQRDRQPLKEPDRRQEDHVGRNHVRERGETAEQQPRGNERLAPAAVGQAADGRHAGDLRERKAGEEDPDADARGAQRLGIDGQKRNHDAHAEHGREDRQIEDVEEAAVQAAVVAHAPAPDKQRGQWGGFRLELIPVGTSFSVVPCKQKSREMCSDAC